jgi:glycosyltransferase involved in cell wall biosynthesis
MKTTCLINNYNYKDFVCDAIDSALSQTLPFDEIIVVDDHSSDGSAELLKEKYSKFPVIKLIMKENNEGQLSTFNVGFLNSIGDIIFFLDADDFYCSQYLEVALDVYERKPTCSFLYCALGKFNHAKQDYQPPTQEQISQSNTYIIDSGYSIILALEEQRFVGSPTSGNSMRRQVLNNILPIPYLEDWRVRADDCIVFGSSIIGARKFFINLPLVAYRIHGENAFHNNLSVTNRFHFYQHQIAFNRLVTFLCHRMNYTVSDLKKNAPYEFKTIEKPVWELFFIYLKIMMNSPSSVPLVPAGLLNKFHGFGMMLKHIIFQNYWHHKKLF